MQVKQAVILAGGMGRRMLPITNRIPKPMIRFYGKPFLWYIIENLKKNNIKKIILLVGYKSEQILKYFGDGSAYGVSITYSYDPIETDTGTRIKNASSLVDPYFLLLYGDVLWPLQINNLKEFYKAPALMTVYRNRDNSTKNNVFVQDGMVIKYDRTRGSADLNGVDIGYFVLDKKVLKDLPGGNFSFEQVISGLVANNNLAGFLTDQKYYGLTSPERIPLIKKYLKPKKVVFLDRDGVINKKPATREYVANWNEFFFLPGAKEALQILHKKGYLIYIITNQAGIARGLINIKSVNDIHKRLKKFVDGVYICPHGWYEECFCRKPNPGLLFTAAAEHGLDLTESICIGDDERDIMAGSRAATRTILVGPNPDATYPTLYEAVEQL